jgi:acyl-CoA synthetase (NDP forming)
LAKFFNPKSVALLGATDKSRWSSTTFANVKNFDGPVYLVNPRGIDVHGSPSYKSILDIPGEVDLAYVMVPVPAVMPVLREVAQKGTKNVVMLTAGFGETGEAGHRLEMEMLDFCVENGITLLGPNGNGYVNAAGDATPYGLAIPVPLIKGHFGIILQSGGLASAVMNFAQSHNVGISTMTAMGNETMITNVDVLRWMVDDPNTKVIGMFIESIRRPAEFLELAQRALDLGKPIVALKVGRSEAGARVAKAHTGSLVGDDAVVDTAFRQYGVIRVNSLEDLVVTSGLMLQLDGNPLPGRRVGFVTASGGACEIISDRCADEGVLIPDYGPATKEALAKVVPDFGTVQNPLDVTGYILVSPGLSRDCITTVAADPDIDIVVFSNDLPKAAPPNPELTFAQFQATAEVIRSVDKPVLLMGSTMGDVSAFGREVAQRSGVPYVLSGIDHGTTAIGRAMSWSEAYLANQARNAAGAGAAGGSTGEALDVAGFAASRGIGGRGTWAEHHAAAFLAGHGVPVVPQELVADADAAVAAAERVGYPVVVKLAADDIEHKSDIGGVKLNIGSPDQVRQAFDEVVAAGRGAGGEVVGALVQPMRPPGLELLVGVITDPAWGHVLAVGFGGVWVEVLRDTALRVLPVDRDEVLAALRSLRGAKLFEGYRGAEPVNLDNVADAVAAVASLAERLGDELETLEINPLLVRGDSVEALDALITWRS